MTSTKIGTPLSQSARKVLLCGAGELGKEVAIELQRLGVEVIAVDRYPQCARNAGCTPFSRGQHVGWRSIAQRDRRRTT
jgi:phosphoglycerate dehydrogenase-like enzyme